MNSVILQLLYGLGCIGVGFFIGLSLSWRQYKIGHKEFAAPELPRTERQQASWLVVVAALSVASAAYAGMQASEQSGCNADFREAIVARSAITAENQKHIDTMITNIADAISTPGPAAQATARTAIIDYRTWVVEADRQRAAHPIADPVCGRG